MGDQMIAKAALTLASIFISVAAPAHAQETGPRYAAGTDLTYTTDADETEVVRAGINFDLRYSGPESYAGFRIERLRYTPSGDSRSTDARFYFRLADDVDGWKYQTAVGTDGRTVVGNASIHNEAPLRQEYFVERDKIETPIGASRGLYYTFGGAAVDVPLGPSTQLTLLSGVQDFTGNNVRLHLRTNFIQTLRSEWGLSVQLRTRYFQDSDRDEYDYYSPRWYAETLPVVQVRRFIAGWRLLAAGGLGAQRDSASGWRASRYLNLRADRRPLVAGWGVTGEALYTSTPVTSSGDYHYLRASIGTTRAF